MGLMGEGELGSEGWGAVGFEKAVAVGEMLSRAGGAGGEVVGVGW